MKLIDPVPPEQELREALEDMVHQFAYYTNGAFITGGLSALEDAFHALGWEDPHPAPEYACARPGCGDRGDCGRPTATGGYEWLCAEHFGEAEEEGT